MKSLLHYGKVLAWSLKHYRREHDVVIETANGLLSVSNKDWLIGKHLFVKREFEIEFIEDSIRFLQSEGWLRHEINETVLDVGANLGMICIAMLGKGFFSNALAFEPAPSSFRLLEKNVRQNNLAEKIKCFNLALSSQNTTFEFEIAGDNSGDNRVRMTNEKGKRGEQKRGAIKVVAQTFDDFVKNNRAIEAHKINLIWLDIQGHEGHFFRGAEKFLKRYKIPCVAEFWGYGIGRAKMTRDEYCAIVETNFTHFYQYQSGNFKARAIKELKNLFESAENPRRVENVIFVNR